MGNCLGEHAVVIGGSMAGLISARVLADFFASVTVLERDHIEEPDRFDITRANAGTHLSFGAGPQMCLRMNLAKLEMRCLFTELAKRVKLFTIIEEHRALHNILRGSDKLIVSVDLH